ncbi:snRNA-activating protein complex subunit 1-like [Pollicipes pollicipes]|uniref:snRNA-activating protein complex subunit 1-like n=1 Tax=Pollicipes pollicipes TaxID=41117 RepID=UPI001884B82F|nr:snRNA-activating protein complex subunit 1-like [Pollicipes pollicipes]
MFSYMLSGRPYICELIEYLQEFLKIVVNLFVSAEQLTRKVGALYLLYGIYMKVPQAARQLVLIRVTPQTLAELKTTRDRAKADDHHDALFVIYQLFHMGAFVFVAHQHEMAPELRHRWVMDQLGEEREAPDVEEPSPVLEYLEDGGLQQLSTLHEKYEAIKRELFQGAAGRRLSTLGTDVAQEISSRLKTVTGGPQPEPPPTSSSSILEQREKARGRAFARFHQPAAAVQSDDETSAGSQQSPLEDVMTRSSRKQALQEAPVRRFGPLLCILRDGHCVLSHPLVFRLLYVA